MNSVSVVLGSHVGDMVPVRVLPVGGVPVEQFPAKRLGKSNRVYCRVVSRRVLDGSAYFSGSAAIRMTEAHLFDKKEILPCAALLEGEYGVNGYYFCVPVIIGAGGVEKIIDINLNAADKKAFDESLNHVKDIVQAMDRILGVG
jgi:malate dehydrogenase